MATADPFGRKQARSGRGRAGLKIPPGISGKLAAAKKVAARKMMAQRLRWIAERPDWLSANQTFAALAARTSGNAAATAILASALLQTARRAENRAQWIVSARVWVWYAGASGDLTKTTKNLLRCARSLTKVRHDGESVSKALQVWRLLAAIDPQSDDAQQGMVWCYSALARLAEQGSDFASAQAQWTKVLELSPENEPAADALRRLSERRPDKSNSSQSRSAAEALFQRLNRAAAADYKSQCAAATRLFHVHAPDLALPFAEGAFRQRRGWEASLLLFRCSMALEHYEQALTALKALADADRAHSLAVKDLRDLLAKAQSAVLANETLTALARHADARVLAPLLIPHLIAQDLKPSVLALSDLNQDGVEWSTSAALQLADYLARAGERERALRFLAPRARHPLLAEAFGTHSADVPPEELERIAFDAAPESAAFCESCLLMAEYHRGRGNLERAADLLCRMIGRAGATRPFYRHHRERIAALVVALLNGAGTESKIARDVAKFVCSWMAEPAKAFYAGADFATLCDRLASATRFTLAPETTRLGILREQYFNYHMERRENRRPESYENDFALCEVALQYFETLGALRQSEEIPVSAALRARLTKGSLVIGSGQADTLMSYAILRDRPECDLKSNSLFEHLTAWYVSRFMPQGKVPGSCVSGELLTSLNAVEYDYGALGVAATRFAQLLRSELQGRKDRYDLANPLDALLFVLEIVIPSLPQNPHHRFAVSAMLPSGGPRGSFADQCVAMLAGRAADVLPFDELLGQRSIPAAPTWPNVAAGNRPQDVLLIGHTGEGTGLGRNFHMLAQALRDDDIALTTLFYESTPDAFAEGLRVWRENCRTPPIVIAAVNAQDIPTLFVRDRHNVLDQCYVAGFFLWETSQAPRLQHLGIRLMNEIWVPTHYVESIYRLFAPVHVVGKGLFAGGGAGRASVPRRGDPIRFLTVFDFHSSIERKNPLASVLAFQKAFQSGENVQLIMKASNVNPQHPGNASAQWERLCAASQSDSRIRIVTARYTEDEMHRLIAGISCVVSLHRAEGFGYMLSDAMGMGIPVVATGYSGNLDFCDPQTSFLASHRLVPVKSHGAHWEGEGAEWAEPDIDSAAAQMMAVYRDYPAALRKAAVARDVIRQKYSSEAFAATLRARLAAIRQPAGVDPVSSAVQ